jgi:hypothetical protein
MSDKAFIILTHVMNARIRAFIDRAVEELAGSYDVHVLGFFPSLAEVPPDFEDHPRATACTISDLRELGFSGVAETQDYRINPGDADMPILWFMRHHPDYTSLWVFEGDVEFTGSLRELVEHLDGSKADLLLTILRRAPADWPHFSDRQLPEGWSAPEETRIHGFLPVFRVSKRLLDAVSAFYSAGGRGHNEWVWPQVALRNGLECRDIAEFPMKGRPLYTSWSRRGTRSVGSFRYRPSMSRPGRRKNTLWHPVKDSPVSLFDEWLTPMAYTFGGRRIGRAISRLRFLERIPKQ